jgi:hypothetical protein
MTDFGADESFGKASEKMKEHYRIEVPISAVRKVTQEHGEVMLGEEEESELGKQGAREVIAGMDGSMIPIVSIKTSEKGRRIRDKRRARELGWREARLCVARDPRSVSGHYRATLGDVQEAGRQLVGCVAEAGGGKTTKLHIVADGAPWIASQVKEQFGEQANFLIDFYHVSEYLAAASELLGKDNKHAWLGKQQRRLKASKTNDVLQDLVVLGAVEKANLTSSGKTATKEEQPASTCRRYIENRLQYMDYKRALQAGLPISSGETESGHRWVIQARLKISGAWWSIANAQRMLKLRTMRASGEWESYWRRASQAAA